jgi:hypothetical protein
LTWHHYVDINLLVNKARWRDMAIVQKITPCLWFDNQAEEAAKFYQIRTRHGSDDADEEAGPAGAATRP